MGALDLLDPSPRPRRATLARAVMAGTALLLVAWILFHGIHLDRTHAFVSDPVRVQAIEAEGGFVAAVHITTVSFHQVHASWHAQEPVEEVLLLRQGDLTRLLAGEPVEPLGRFAGGRLGTVAVDSPGADCSGVGGACVSASLPVLAWISGTGWEGRSLDSARNYSIPAHPDARQARLWQGPVMVDMMSAKSATYHAQAPFVATSLVLMAAGASAALVHLHGMRQARQEGRTLPEAEGLRAATTEDLLVLSRLCALHYESLRRQFLLSALFILLAVGTLMALALPLLLGDLDRLYPNDGDEPSRKIVWLAGPFLAALSFAAWWAAYDQVRGRIRRWRDAARSLQADLARMLEA